MGAKAILDAAYRAGVVPQHLHGRTQQKTLQARLSEDILNHRERSAFYRTEPGQFALTEFINDPEFPAKWKTPFPARRRTRDLKRTDSLAVKAKLARALVDQSISIAEFIERVEEPGALASMHPEEMEKQGYCAIWTFSLVQKNDCILSYRVGRYRDDRDTFANRRSIGFPGALAADDVSFFSDDRLGVQDCSIAVLQHDLDLSLAVFERDGPKRPIVEGVTAILDINNSLDIVVVLSWESPDWFEPTTRRLSLNDPTWLCRSSRPNDIDDFEPWSARVLQWLSTRNDKAESGSKKDHRAAGRLPQV